MMRPDTELLDAMVADQAAADSQWQATAYWKEIAAPLIEHFRNPKNVLEFRSSPIRTGIRTAFPGNPGRIPTLAPKGRLAAGLLSKVPMLGKVIREQEEIQAGLVAQNSHNFRHSLDLSYMLLKEMQKGVPVLDDRMVGDPDDHVEIDGRNYSHRLMGYEYLYVRAMRSMAGAKINSLAELGSGYGGQIEVFLRKLENIKCVAIDIPPWLYIAELYLTALFPGEVLGYRETRTIKDKTALLDQMKGRRIAILPAWKVPLIMDRFDMFWNSKSLQEMNDNAQNYIDGFAGRSRRMFLHVYRPPRAGIHSPELLRQMVEKNGGMKTVLCEDDLFAEKRSVCMLFENSQWQEHSDKQSQARERT